MNMCSICRHQNVAEINKSLLDGRPLRSIAAQWSTSKTALIRHRAHLPAALVKAQGAAEIAKADVLLDHVKTAEGRAERLYSAAEQILTRALAEDAPRTALQAIKAAVDVMGEARQYLELRGLLAGELGGGPGGTKDGDRPTVIINFPQLTPEQIYEMEHPVVIDLPQVSRRLLQRPSDGKPR